MRGRGMLSERLTKQLDVQCPLPESVLWAEMDLFQKTAGSIDV